jgi:imidazolonepropionase-like amidohydrolase
VAGADGPIPATEDAARARLQSWADTGISLIRDVGSPGGSTLDLLDSRPGPRIEAAGRFMAPAGRYYQALLGEPVGSEDLLVAARGEVARGATWVKIIGDFPRMPERVGDAMTYPIDVVAEVVAAVHDMGARVAVHTVLPGAAEAFVAAGVDSIEHGPALNADTLREMARRGTAWTPTLCALLSAIDAPDLSPERRDSLNLLREALAQLIPEAVRLGVPLLAGTDVVGTISREVALLTRLGLDPKEALGCASDTARGFLGETAGRIDLVTYAHDPREDPAELDNPLAVVVNGQRLR